MTTEENVSVREAAETIIGQARKEINGSNHTIRCKFWEHLSRLAAYQVGKYDVNS